MSLYLGEKLVSGIGQDRIADTLPIGAIIEWDSDLIPENWLLLNGQAVSRTVYSELFALYGTKYGAGDGSTTFNLPDRRTRVSVGKDIDDSDFNILGNTGGEKTHVHSLGQENQTYADFIATSNVLLENYIGIPSRPMNLSFGFSSGQTSSGINSSYAVPVKGETDKSDNLQPYIVTNFIVKAKLYTTEFIGGNLVIDNLTSDSSVNVLSARMGKELHEEIRPITTGGTGANNAEQALKNLGGLPISSEGVIDTDMIIDSINIIFNDDADGSKFASKMDEIIATMPNNSMKLLTFSDYPADGVGYAFNGWLFKSNDNYAHVFGSSCSNRAVKTIHRAKFNGVWYPWKWGLDEDTGIQMVKLWENASPTSEFGEQGFQIALNKYDAKIVEFSYDKYEESTTFTIQSPANGSIRLFVSGHSLRRVTVNDNGTYIYFSPSTGGNDKLIPLRIYGIKGVQ